jgi:hypothetical protein
VRSPSKPFQSEELRIMPVRKLPPLLVGGSYTCPPLSNVDFTPPDLARELKGETTASLRVRLSNEVALEMPVRAFQLQMLMASLMRAFPQQALANLRFSEEEEGAEGGPGRTRGAGH